MQFILWGGMLLLLPVLLAAFVRLTPHSHEYWSKGFGGRWNRSETLAFFLLLLIADTRGWVLIVPWMIGLFLLASGVAQTQQFSLPLTLLCEGMAMLASLLTVVCFYILARRTKLTSPWPASISTSSASSALRLHTPYRFDRLIVTMHTYRKRRSFRSIPNRFEPEDQIQPETWFIEFACLLKNCARKEAVIWAQLEEVLPEHAEPHVPLLLRQSIPLSEDEEADREIGSDPVLSSAQYGIVVKDTLESKLFFKLNESMNGKTMAFSLYLYSKNQGPRRKLLFTVEV